MGWVVLFSVAWLLVLVLVPANKWKRLWPAGVIGLASVYAIDSTFIGLGAFSYSRIEPGLSGLPVFYLLSVVGFSILLAYFYPDGSWKQIFFVILAALAFLLVEVIMSQLNYFHYQSWSPARSYLLDISGVIVVLWSAQRAGAVGKGS